MAVNKLGIGRIVFPSTMDKDLKIALEDLVIRLDDNITTTYTATDLDSLILCNATGGAFTVTLPAVAGVSGKKLTIKKTDASGNAVTVDGNGAETIDGAATASLASQYKYISVISNGVGWFVTSLN
jgi:hypothetical protein